MKKPIIFVLLFIFLINIFGLSNNLNFEKNNNAYAESEQLNITAKSALLIDYDSEQIIYEKNSNERLPIASMTKIASLWVIFDAIERGAIKEKDEVRVSENAARVGGSSAFLDAGSSYKVCDLIKTVIVASANDSTVALAEHLYGSEEIFVSKMNKFAQNLNLKDTNFANSTGLPINNHYSSAMDMAKIYKQICNNNLYKKYSKIWLEDFVHPSGRKTGLVNTNKLVRTFDGIEGGKTGYTDAAKFCLTASASRGSTRLVGVVIGVSDSKTRFAEMTKLLSFGFANYETQIIVNKEIPLTISSVKKSKDKIEIYPERNSQIFAEKTNQKSYTTDYKLNDIVAPVKAGDVVGKLFVFDANNMVVDEVRLVSKNDASKENLKDIIGRLVSIW